MGIFGHRKYGKVVRTIAILVIHFFMLTNINLGMAAVSDYDNKAAGKSCLAPMLNIPKFEELDLDAIIRFKQNGAFSTDDSSIFTGIIDDKNAPHSYSFTQETQEEKASQSDIAKAKLMLKAAKGKGLFAGEKMTLSELLQYIAIVGLNGNKNDYYDAKNILTELLNEGHFTDDQKEVISGLRDHISSSYEDETKERPELDVVEKPKTVEAGSDTDLIKQSASDILSIAGPILREIKALVSDFEKTDNEDNLNKIKELVSFLVDLRKNENIPQGLSSFIRGYNFIDNRKIGMDIPNTLGVLVTWIEMGKDAFSNEINSIKKNIEHFEKYFNLLKKFVQSDEKAVILKSEGRTVFDLEASLNPWINEPKSSITADIIIREKHLKQFKHSVAEKRISIAI